MKVLITNYSLASRGGTELYVRDLAIGLSKRGHTPIVYSPELGMVAEEIRKATIPVVNDLTAIAAAPDIIHGHHLHETMTALVRFPGVPAIYVCHDWYSRLDAPPKLARILRYVAVDQVCYDKLVYERAIPEERVHLVPSFVDLERFAPRAPLPPRPRRALLLCNYAEEGQHLNAARQACARAGIELDAMGKLLGSPCEQPERILGRYDIVLAKGRAALEALATGTSVILHVQRSLGPMVTADNIERLLPLNCGIRAMTALPDPAAFARALLAEIERYDPLDAALASQRVRGLSGRDRAADEFISIYERTIAESKSNGAKPDCHDEAPELAAYLQELLLSVREERRALQMSHTFRLKERLRRTPLFGKFFLMVGRRLTGRASG